MKPFLFFAMFCLLIWSCSPTRNASKTSAQLVQESQDSTEYEVIIIDIHFDQWYLLNYNEAKDRTNDYYRSQNLVAVAKWNELYRSGKNIDAIDSFINYEPQIDYGIEVNRKLFWYFKFVQEYYNIKLFY